MKALSGINMIELKKMNRKTILNLLREPVDLSRKDIAEKMGLSAAAVTILVNEMINEGILFEAGTHKGNNKAGRKKVFIKLNKDFSYMIGINIEIDNISVVIANLALEVLSSSKIKTSKIKSINEFSTCIEEEIKRQLWDLNIPKNKVIGIGIGIIGSTEIKENDSDICFFLRSNYSEIKESIEKVTGINVIIDNNVRALALAELMFSDYKDMIFIKVGPGIGSAIIHDNKIYTGAHNKAGEIGHIIFDPMGEKCRCGQRGCLETFVSYKRIAKLLNINQDDFDIKDILNRYEEGDTKVVEIINNVSSYISLGIINANKILNPNKIILYGEIFNNKKFVSDFLNDLENKFCFKDKENKILVSKLEANKALGPVALVYNKYFIK